jgi:hypothetical protein
MRSDDMKTSENRKYRTRSYEHGPHWKRRVQQFFHCAVCIRYRANVSTKQLPGNDMGMFTEPLPSNDRGIFTEPLPSNDKEIFTEPLHNNDRRGDTQTHTHRQQRDLISLLYFFKIRKAG